MPQMARMNANTLSSIIGDIYDCTLNPSGWTAVLTRIATAVDAAYTTISLASTSDLQGRMAAHSPWDKEQLRILNDEYGVHGIPGLSTVLFGDVDTPWATLSSMTEDDFQQSPFYKNWVKPQGLRDGCITKFAHTADRIGLIGAVTRANRDIVTADERHFLSLLSPHLRRAALIGDLLDQSRVMTSLYKTALDRLETAVVLSDASATVLYANGQAQSMFSAGRPIISASGKLKAANDRATAALVDALARTTGDEGSLGRRGIGIPVSAQGEAPAVAYVLPLTLGSERAVYRPATAAVFISTAAKSAPPPETTLITLFDLTPAEARVMTQIGSGSSSVETAKTLNISENTLKTHLGRVFSKTGSERQADLLKILHDIAPPVVNPV